MTRNAAENLIDYHNRSNSVEGGRFVKSRRPTPIDIRNPDKLLDTTLAENFAWDIVTGLSGGNSYGPAELRQLFESGYHPAFFGKETGTPPDTNVLTSKATYVLQRLVAKEHISFLANAEIHFTDNAQDFYKETDGKTVDAFKPDKRDRVYRVDTDGDGRKHITYLLRHSYTDNYIDAFEMVSFLSFTEFYKKSIRKNGFNYEGEEGKELEKNLKSLGFTQDTIKTWANKDNQQLILSSSKDFSLQPPWVTGNVISHAVSTIENSVQKIGEKIPDHVIMGNDFSMPLMATLGLFDHEDVERVFKLGLNKEEIDQEVSKMKKEIDKEIIRKFRVYQYLNTYKGNNPELLQMKNLLDSTIGKIRTRVVSATATGLGSPVDIIDFSGLSTELIEKIEHPKIKELMFNLHKKKARVLSLAYPLGENIYPLVELFNQKLGINNIDFFGKVGAVINKDGSGAKRGRVVSPSLYIRVGDNQKKDFENGLKPSDTIILRDADRVRLAISTNGVLSQTEQDIKDAMGRMRGEIILDSESYYYQKVLRALKMIGLAFYYVSDNTNLDGSLLVKDMTKAMGAQGTLAALEACLTILNKRFGDKKLTK